MFESADLTDYTARETLASLGDLHALRNHIDLEILRHAHHFADLHPGPSTISDHELRPGGEQSRVYGGSGCPTVAEFAVAEFGVMIGRSTTSAAKYMGQALALRHRLPRTWSQVESGHATPWKACNIASACRELSEEAAALVDSRVADIVDTLTPLRLHNIVKAALWEADPITARARAEERARERGVWPGRTDDHGTTTFFIKAATGDVIRFEATITQLADALAALSDTSSLNERRARAIGILANPGRAAELLRLTQHLTTTNPAEPAAEKSPAEETGVEPRTVRSPNDEPDGAPTAADSGGSPAEDTDFDSAAHRALNGKIADLTSSQRVKRQRTNTTLYLHITDETLFAGEGIARVEGFGPVLATRLEELIGHNQITIKPVIDLGHALAVDAYEIPQRIREHIKLRYPAEQFVYGTAESSRTPDLDHIDPFKPTGPPGQTNTNNLIPLRRFSHRVKTHGHWQVRRLTDDALEWTTRHGFKFIVDHRGTHPVDRQ
jgi:hypothetical protein